MEQRALKKLDTYVKQFHENICGETELRDGMWVRF